MNSLSNVGHVRKECNLFFLEVFWKDTNKQGCLVIEWEINHIKFTYSSSAQVLKSMNGNCY